MKSPFTTRKVLKSAEEQLIEVSTLKYLADKHDELSSVLYVNKLVCACLPCVVDLLAIQCLELFQGNGRKHDVGEQQEVFEMRGFQLVNPGLR